MLSTGLVRALTTDIAVPYGNPMRSLLSLAPTLLLASSVQLRPSQAQRRWSQERSAGEKYWPEHETLARRDDRVPERVANRAPIGIRRMSGDPGEKFFLDYWVFGDSDTKGASRTAEEHSDGWGGAQGNVHGANVSTSQPLLPPYLLHSDHDRHDARGFLPRSILQRRDYQCPAGTSPCTGIRRPDSCCGRGQQCVLVEDTGLGDVGCCAEHARCAGRVSNCDVSEGYSSCPDSENGGCCIPGYQCDGVGCMSSPLF